MLLQRKHRLVYLFAGLLLILHSNGVAQSLQYSRQNIFIDNVNTMQMAAGVSGTHHLICCNNNENISLFIYDDALGFKKKVITPILFIERTTVRVISFDQYYYLWMRSRYGNKTWFWRIDSNGNCTELSGAFQKLLRSQSKNIESVFQLYKQQNELCMSYRTYLPKIEKNVFTLLQLDSGLHISNTRKAMYAFKIDEEKILQETFIPDNNLLVLKISNNNASLKLMKVSRLTGMAIANEFTSSGYYTQCSLSYSNTDSVITVTALLSKHGRTGQKNYVFVSCLDTLLLEKTPFTLLKSQFKKNTGTDFLMMDGMAGWVRIKKVWPRAYNLDLDNKITVFLDHSIQDSSSRENARENYRPVNSFNRGYNPDYLAQLQDVRFSLLDKNLQLAVDTLIRNNRDSYTLNPDDFYRFEINNSSYLIMGQFFRRVRGLLMIQSNGERQIANMHLPVMGKYNYLLAKAQVVSNNAVVIPYLYKDQAGLMKVVIE